MSSVDLLRLEIVRTLMKMAKKSTKSGVWEVIPRVVKDDAFTACPELNDDAIKRVTPAGMWWCARNGLSVCGHESLCLCVFVR